MALKDIVFGTLVVSLSFGVYYYNKYEQLHPQNSEFELGEKKVPLADYFVRGPEDKLTGIKTTYFIDKEEFPSLTLSNDEQHQMLNGENKVIYSEVEYDNGLKDGEEKFYSHRQYQRNKDITKQTTYKKGIKHGKETIEYYGVEIQYNNGLVSAFRTGSKKTVFKDKKPYDGEVMTFKGNISPKMTSKINYEKGLKTSEEYHTYNKFNDRNGSIYYKGIGKIPVGNWTFSEISSYRERESNKANWNNATTTIPYKEGKKDGVEKVYFYYSGIHPENVFVFIETSNLNKSSRLLKYKEIIWNKGNKVSETIYNTADKKNKSSLSASEIKLSNKLRKRIRKETKKEYLKSAIENITENIAEAPKDKKTKTYQWTKKDLMDRGKSNYLTNCAGCHKKDGTGMPPVFPALKNNATIAESNNKDVKIIINGKGGMPEFKMLSDIDLASIATYIRNSLGNKKEIILPNKIKEFR